MLSFQPSAQDVDGARAALVLIMAGVAIFWHLVPPGSARDRRPRGTRPVAYPPSGRKSAVSI
jgi:hypothetical protein